MVVNLALSPEQTAKVRQVRDEMRGKALALGERFVTKKHELQASFQSGEIREEELDRGVREIERTSAQLRIAHLAAHVEVWRILTKEQAARYGRLRGYC